MTRNEYINDILSMSTEERHAFILGIEVAYPQFMSDDPDECSDISCDAIMDAEGEK